MLTGSVRGAPFWAALLVVVLASPAYGQVPDVEGGALRPDLIPGNIQVSNKDERSESRVCATALNVAERLNRTTGYYVEITIDRNDSVEWVRFEEDLARDSVGISGGDYAQFCWNFTLPAGRYRASTIVDSAHEVEESNEHNNVKTTGQIFTILAAPEADLVVAAFQVSPSVSRNNSNQLFYVAVSNRGTATANWSYVDIVDDNGLIGRHRVGPLAPGKVSTFVTTTDPRLRPSGTFRAQAIADSLGNVTEIDEDNNIETRYYTVQAHPAPDLRINGGLVEGTRVARHGLHFTGSLENAGNATATNVTVRLLVDNHPTANWTGGSLLANASVSFDFYFILTEGNHTLTLIADPEKKITEIDETNNEYSTDVTIGASTSDLILPNLVVERFDGSPDNPGPNEVVNLTILVHNVGDAKSNATNVLFLQGNRKLGTSFLPALEVDRYYVVRFAWPSQVPGPYTMRAAIDPENAINETDEFDNNYTLYFTIYPPPAPTPPQPKPVPPVTNTTQPPPDLEPNTLTPPAPATNVEITHVDLGTRAVPGGVKGTITAALRNPSLDPLGRVTVSFRIDGQVVKEYLVQSITGAGTAGATTGDIDLPPGTHDVTVEARIVGTGQDTIATTKTYTAEAGPRAFLPAPGIGLLGLVIVSVALALRKRVK